MKNRPRPGKQVRLTAKTADGYLRSRGIPETMIRAIRLVYADRAVQDSHEVKMNRIYSIVALSLRRQLGWGIKRISRFLDNFSDLYQEFVESGDNWTHLMETLRNETGIIIRTGEEGDEVMEYADEDEREAK